MKHSFVSRLLILTIGFLCLIGIHTTANAKAGNNERGYIAVGCFSGVFESDGVTPLKDGSIVQCLYAGPDGKIDPPNPDRTPGGDDVLLRLAFSQKQFYTAIGERSPSAPKDEGKFIDLFKHKLNKGDVIYCRAWNGSTLDEATCYGDSEIYTIQHQLVDFNIFNNGKKWTTNVCPCSIEICSKTKEVTVGDTIDCSKTRNVNPGGTIDFEIGRPAGFETSCTTTPCYSWQLTQNESGATITQDPTDQAKASYVAGSSSGIDIVMVIDDCNQVSAFVEITVTTQDGDTDGDGVPDATDKCPESNFDETIIIGSCDSGVTNQLFEDGCTMSDLIAKTCDVGGKNHGKLVSCVSHLTNEWKDAGLISDTEKGAIQSCAAKSKKDKGHGNGKGKGKGNGGEEMMAEIMIENYNVIS